MDFLTFQDFLEDSNKAKFIGRAITEHQLSEVVRVARDADQYDHQRNVTINNYVRTIFTATGNPLEDFTASNNKIASNLFHRLNTQRCTYSLGNGVSFSDHKETRRDTDGLETTVDLTKEKLGDKFDTALKKAGYKALIHGVTFGFWNVDQLHVFPVTEFVPLWDEETGILRAGIRYWRLAPDKPAMAVLYEEDGYTKYKSEAGLNNYDFKVVEEKRGYKQTVQHNAFEGDIVIGEENYGILPIIPLWGSSLKQSTLVGMQQAIDSYDLIRSGFANDLTDCAQIYWILENCSGMNDTDIAKFRDRLKIQHIAVVDTANGSKVTPYSQDIPATAREQYLDRIRAGIYEDFGGLDVHTVAAGATNDHIDAAYQPMDEEADDFEYQVIEFVQQILALMGIEDTPVFKRNRISNQTEQTQMIISAAQYLDSETVLQKLPFVSTDEVQNILIRKDAEGGSLLDDDEDGGEEPEGNEGQENPFGNARTGGDE